MLLYSYSYILIRSFNLLYLIVYILVYFLLYCIRCLCILNHIKMLGIDDFSSIPSKWQKLFIYKNCYIFSLCRYHYYYSDSTKKAKKKNESYVRYVGFFDIYDNNHLHCPCAARPAIWLLPIATELSTKTINMIFFSIRCLSFSGAIIIDFLPHVVLRIALNFFRNSLWFFIYIYI